MITWKNYFSMFVYVETVNLHTLCIFAKETEVLNVLFVSWFALSSGVCEGFDWGEWKR